MEEKVEKMEVDQPPTINVEETDTTKHASVPGPDVDAVTLEESQMNELTWLDASEVSRNPLEIPEVVERVLSSVTSVWDIGKMELVSKTFQFYCWNNLEELSIVYLTEDPTQPEADFEFGHLLFCGKLMKSSRLREFLPSIWKKADSLRQLSIGASNWKEDYLEEELKLLKQLDSLSTRYPVDLRVIDFGSFFSQSPLPFIPLLIRAHHRSLEVLKFRWDDDFSTEYGQLLCYTAANCPHLKKVQLSRLCPSAENEELYPDYFHQMFSGMSNLAELDLHMFVDKRDEWDECFRQILMALQVAELKTGTFHLRVRAFGDLRAVLEECGEVGLSFITSITADFFGNPQDDYGPIFSHLPKLVKLLVHPTDQHPAWVPNYCTDLMVQFLWFYSDVSDGKDRVLIMDTDGVPMKDEIEHVIKGQVEALMNLTGQERTSGVMFIEGNAQCLLK